MPHMAINPEELVNSAEKRGPIDWLKSGQYVENIRFLNSGTALAYHFGRVRDKLQYHSTT